MKFIIKKEILKFENQTEIEEKTELQYNCLISYFLFCIKNQNTSKYDFFLQKLKKEFYKMKFNIDFDRILLNINRENKSFSLKINDSKNSLFIELKM